MTIKRNDLINELCIDAIRIFRGSITRINDKLYFDWTSNRRHKRVVVQVIETSADGEKTE